MKMIFVGFFVGIACIVIGSVYRRIGWFSIGVIMSIICGILILQG